MIRLRNAAPPIVAADLDEVENRFGFRFPQELRLLYLHYNGGRPENDRFVDDNGQCIIHDILPIKHGGRPRGTLERTIQLVKCERHLLPDYLVPFAIDPFGNYYCFSVRSEDGGGVFAFRMDRAGEPQLAIEFLAPSIGSFLDSLQRKPELKK